jgi:hypothetical protein
VLNVLNWNGFSGRMADVMNNFDGSSVHKQNQSAELIVKTHLCNVNLLCYGNPEA